LHRSHQLQIHAIADLDDKTCTNASSSRAGFICGKAADGFRLP
jgi:hypothetical protein